MNDRFARWIFWVGTLVSLALFIGLTVDSHARFAALTNADKLDEQVVAGKRAFERYNCNDCHTILGFGAYYAPDLTRAWTRLGEVGVQRRLEHPETVFATSFRKMPQQGLSAQEVADIGAYLQWVSKIDNHDWPPQDSSKRWKSAAARAVAGASLSPGAALIDQERCLACHTLGDSGGTTASRLEYIGSHRDAAWIAQYLADPEAFSQGTGMPAYPHLRQEQRLLIGDFMVAAAAASKAR
jgi:nitric oxide reductase subunit C